ncbi:MAG: sulfatase-like hydrolase/transferase [bacterium]|nr:sulfatase-like hydrolase/transferase [bacterium]
MLTLAEILQARGYATCAIVSSVVLDSKFAMDQGFDVYDDSLADAVHNRATAQRPGGETTEKALEWLTANADRKKFLFLHYYDPHGPYSPPAPFAGRFEDPYDGEIAFTDHCIGRVLDRLDALGLLEEALIVAADPARVQAIVPHEPSLEAVLTRL